MKEGMHIIKFSNPRKVVDIFLAFRIRGEIKFEAITLRYRTRLSPMPDTVQIYMPQPTI
jgi:hypothetical protein